jgi:hypothetical protein
MPESRPAESNGAIAQAAKACVVCVHIDDERWPSGTRKVAEALEQKVRAGDRMMRVAEGQLRLSEAGRKLPAVAESNQAFRGIRTFIRAVQALSSLLGRYRQ